MRQHPTEWIVNVFNVLWSRLVSVTKPEHCRPQSKHCMENCRASVSLCAHAKLPKSFCMHWLRPVLLLCGNSLILYNMVHGVGGREKSAFGSYSKPERVVSFQINLATSPHPTPHNINLYLKLTSLDHQPNRDVISMEHDWRGNNKVFSRVWKNKKNRSVFKL